MSDDKIPSSHEKSIILSENKWNEILHHLKRDEDVKLEAEAELRYKEFLYKESRAMTDKWENSLKATVKAKEDERMKNEQMKVDDAADRFKKLKENDEIKRFEENIKAIDQMQKLKMGPRLLDSAYVTSECAAVREMQLDANLNFRAMKRERELAMGRDAIVQDEQYAEQQNFIISESKRRQDAYKKELRQFIEKKERQQIELKNDQCEEERLERSRIDSDLTAQLSKERRILEKKKEAKRQIALEAMQMAEKRRIREKQVEALENQIASIFDAGNNIIQVKQQNEKEKKLGKEQFHNSVWKTALADIKNTKTKEDESIKRAVNEFQAKLRFKDQAKIEERRRIKQMQIKNHLDDLAREKIRKQRQQNEMKRDIENRIRNEEVNVEFDQQKRLEALNRNKQHRRIITEQIEERKQRDQDKDYTDLISLDKMNLQEDNAFFTYANELVNDAIQKDRPVYPLVKVIEQYKSTNNVNSKKLVYAVDELKAMRPSK